MFKTGYEHTYELKVFYAFLKANDKQKQEMINTLSNQIKILKDLLLKMETYNKLEET